MPKRHKKGQTANAPPPPPPPPPSPPTDKVKLLLVSMSYFGLTVDYLTIWIWI